MVDSEMKEIVIRELRQEDIPAVVEIEQLSGFHERDWERFLQTFDSSREEEYKIFVVVVQGKIVGKVELVIGLDKTNKKGYLCRLAVHPDHRRKGYATELMKHTLAYAKRKNVEMIELHVTEGNELAIRLYKRLHFSEKHKDIHFIKDIRS